MLIFKTNIYETQDGRMHYHSDALSRQPINLFNLLKNTLQDDLDFFNLMERSHEGILIEDLASFYPRAHKFGGQVTLKTLLNNLQEGLLNRKTWYRMNTYHFCMLYDSILRQAYNYNHDNSQEQIRLYPEMKGAPLQVDRLIDDLFFNTVFLMQKEKYDQMTPEDKKNLGFTCPCQFGVIHDLAPNPEEMKLKSEPGFPYSIIV